MNERRTLPSFFCFCAAGCLCFSVCLLLVVAGLFFLYCFGLFTSKPYTNVLRWLLLISFALLLHKNEEPCYIQCVSSLVCLIPMCRDTFFFNSFHFRLLKRPVS
jgi:hypothetical protein